MSDLNDWVLDVNGVQTQFGHSTTDYPFAGQVSIGAVDRTIQDNEHPDVDGDVMGRDRLRGFNLEFDCTILREYPVTAKPYLSALDLYDTFAARWRGDAVRLTPGQYATCRNTERNRMVVGRPRDIAPKLAKVRKGFLDFQMDFRSVAPDFYSIDTNTLGGGVGTHVGNNTGSLAAWPKITIDDAIAPVVTLRVGGVAQWSVSLAAGVPMDNATIVIDTRPWRRSVTLDGAPANGRLLGNRLSQCKVPVGAFDVVLASTGGTAPTVSVEYHRAYAGL